MITSTEGTKTEKVANASAKAANATPIFLEINKIQVLTFVEVP